MPISLTCTSCNKRLKAKDSLAGKIVPCPGCGEKLSIPQPDAEADAASFLLADHQPEPEPETREEHISRPPRRSPAVAPRSAPPAAPLLPVLKSDETPGWLRHLHWLLVLALIPLGVSLFQRDESEEELQARFVESIEDAPPEIQFKIAMLEDKLDEGKASEDELFALLPGSKLKGALLPRNSWAHWGMAAGAAVLFMAFFLLLSAHGGAEPTHILGSGLFTATAGILLLLFVQFLADVTSGFVIVGGSIVAIISWVLHFIAFSYRMAADPSNGFWLSFLGFTLGVGLLEELVKAIPLLLHYRQPSDQSWRGAFLWGLASGAGFGIAEGIIYSSSMYNGVHGPSIYVVRFISCVALHALWTGSVGITINQRQALIQQEMSWYEYIPPIFLMISVPMVLHSLYDTLLKKEMNAIALGVAALSFAFLAFQIYRLHGADDEEANKRLLAEYKRRRAAMA
jgi:RsiW-degrading membrane proteinase PrsW (M82 family)